MTQYVLNQLLESKPSQPQNLQLLKKIMLTVNVGYFRINDQAPDNKISLGDYLFDDERIMFDYTRVSPHHKDLFLQWLVEPHAENQKKARKTTYLSENRGYTSELSLNYWGKFINWFRQNYSSYWKISSFKLALQHQLLGIQIDTGKLGSLIEFKQFEPPGSGSKYKSADDLQVGSLGNTKRVYLTDKMIEQLVQSELNSFNYKDLYNKPHSQSIAVFDLKARHKAMREFRQTQRFIDPQPWYQRFWNWVLSFFVPKPTVKRKHLRNKFNTLYENKLITLSQRDGETQILLKEKKPEVENLVFCGGGAKIFAHVGVWKALCEAKIKPHNFIGSSAGAMMSLLCYLGFNAEEIDKLFREIKQEHVILFNFDINGCSEPHSLKTVIDYAIALKVKQLVDKYNIPFPEGKITFSTLEDLRIKFPDCGIGRKLIVTATNLTLNKVTNFSLELSPLLEVSEAVKISASMPIVFRPTLIDGHSFIDGGVMSNFPTEACIDDHSTLLEFVNLLAIQFDNGTERAAIDRLDDVYRDGWFANWVYSKLTGVRDPAAGWYDDRVKLRKHAAQTIVPKVEVSSTSFRIDESARNKLIKNGYEAAKDYLEAHYELGKDGRYENTECLYATFNSLSDLLVYCCFRGNEYWFDIVAQLIKDSSIPQKDSLIKQCSNLKSLHFNKKQPQLASITQPLLNPKKDGEGVSTGLSFFKKPADYLRGPENNLLLLELHPLFRRICSELVKTKPDKLFLDKARHALTLDTPFQCLEYLTKIQESNILLHIIIHLMKELEKEHKINKTSSAQLSTLLKQISSLLDDKKEWLQPEYFGKWDLTFAQCLRVMKLSNDQDKTALINLLNDLRIKSEPMQIVKDGVFYEDEDPHCFREERSQLAMH